MAGLFSRFDPSRFLPYPSQYLDIDGVKLHYFDIGPRVEQTVILLHGNPTWSFYYRNLMRALAVRSRVIVPDYIGCGLSDHPVDRHYRASERVDHLERLLDHCRVKRFSLVMHDWGGPLGTSLAERRVSLVDRLVYLNTTLTETEHLPGFIKFAAHPWFGPLFTQKTRSFLKVMLRFGVVRNLPKDIRQGYLFPYLTAARRTAIWDFVQDIPFNSDHPSFSSLQEVTEKLVLLKDKPVMIYWGLRDPCFHRGMLSQVHRHFPHAEVVERAAASHLVLEDAVDDACIRIPRFLDPTSPAVGLSADDRSDSVVAIAAPGAARPCGPEFLGSALYERATRFEQRHESSDAAIVVAGQGAASRALVGTGTEDPLMSARVSFQELFARVRQYERGLSQLGLDAGDRVVMLVPPGIDFLALSYAVMGRGAVPVFLDPGMGKNNLLRCIHDLAPRGFIGAPKAHLLRIFKPSLFKGLAFSIVAGDLPIPGAYSTSFLRRFSSQAMTPVSRDGTEAGLIAFTSGATGTPKGVLFTNEMLAAQSQIFEQFFGLKAESRDLPLLPVFSLFTLALGIGSVFAPLDPARPLDLDPELMVRVINQFKVSSSFGSPTLWNKIADYCTRHHLELPQLSRVYMAGAPVSPRVLQQVQRAAPNAVVATPYGATEALPVTMVTANELLKCQVVPAASGELGTPVGKPVPGVEVRIIQSAEVAIADISEATLLPPRSIGEVIVRGANVSPAYLHRPDANVLGKIRDGETFWHRMGDTGYLDSEGRLYFCGRKVHAVKAADRVYYSDPVERVFNEHGKVRRSALISLQGGAEPAVAIEPLPEYFPRQSGDRERFVAELRELAQQSPLTQRIERFYFHPSFPVDARHNAKIFREKLSDWARGLGEKESR